MMTTPSIRAPLTGVRRPSPSTWLAPRSVSGPPVPLANGNGGLSEGAALRQQMLQTQAEQKLLHAKIDRLLQETTQNEKERLRQTEALYAAIAGATQPAAEEKPGRRRPPRVLSDLGKEFIRALVSVFATAIGTYVAQRVILRVLEQRDRAAADAAAHQQVKETI